MDKKVKRDKGRFAAWRWLQDAERPEIMQRADENLALRNRGGCAAFVTERIAANDVEGAVGFQDVGDAIVVG